MQVRVLFPAFSATIRHNPTKFMNELKQRLMEKVGLDEEKSAQAIEEIAGFIKEKLPESIHGMVDNLLKGEGGGNPLDAVKGFFGR